MIVSCPACSARLRLDRQRLGGKRLTLRCARCQEVFRVEVPLVSDSGNELRVLVGHSDPEICAAISDVLVKAGMVIEICHDGSSALETMEARPPRVAIIDVALPGLYAFEVVEKVRNRPGLENVRIILLSSVYNKMAYKRTPSSLYGADDYVEKHHIPDFLVPKVRRLLGADEGAPADSTDRRAPDDNLAADREAAKPSLDFIEQTNARIRDAEEGKVDGAAPEEVVVKARRLARIIVSDIALYNQEKVEEGVREGSFFELLDNEIAEGRRLYQSRVPDEVHRQEDFLQQEFLAFIDRRRRELQL